jgi:hypothetical protein
MINEQLTNLYEEVMWLRARPNVTSSVARSWFTHSCSVRLKKHIRRFSGLVSLRATEPEAVLRLEHHLRIQTTLTQLVERHFRECITDSDEFVRMVLHCEEVHIVTFKENYLAMGSKGDYEHAGIDLVDFHTLSAPLQQRLWSSILRKNVSNHGLYNPANKKPKVKGVAEGRSKSSQTAPRVEHARNGEGEVGD